MNKKDKGVTRQSIEKVMMRRRIDDRIVPCDIQWLSYCIRSWRLPTDVTIQTALNNMIKDGLVERVEKKYSAYDGRLYRLLKTL